MIKVDHKSNKPLYEQIIDNIKEMVVKGVLKEDDSIPSVRKLALMIDVNPNTISKAYRELERENIIRTIKGKGAYIASSIEKKPDERKLEETKDKLKPLLIEFKYFNLSNDEIVKIVTNMLDDFDSEEAKNA